MRPLRLLPALSCFLLFSQPAWAVDTTYPSGPFGREETLISTGELPTDVKAADVLPSVQEHPESWKEFLQERTQIGVGYDLTYDSNTLLQDNNRQVDYISTLEGVVLFTDPRGALLYGTQWEANAFRYMKKNANAINHDIISFIDFDPGGRIQYHLTHTLELTNSLTFGSPDVDVLRVSGSDFQHFEEQSLEGRIRYNVSEDDILISETSYSAFDDTGNNDASSDRKTFKTSLDFGHSITRTWSVSVGTAYDNRYVPGDKLKNSDAYSVRMGARHELSPSEVFTVLLEYERPRTRTQKPSQDLNYKLSFEHAVNPRTQLKLGLSSARVTSFATGRTDFRSTVPSFVVGYQLTPLVTLNFSGDFNRQKSSSRDTMPVQINETYTLGFGVLWQIREQAKVTLDYSNRRSKTRDYTSRILTAGFEATF